MDKLYTALGLMSGTSLDGIDASILTSDGENIIKHKNIHLGMAAALPTGNLIVPVIRKAQEKNISKI